MSTLLIPLSTAAAADTPKSSSPGKPVGGVLSERLSVLSRQSGRGASAAEESESVGLPPNGPASLLRHGRSLLAYVQMDEVDDAARGRLTAAGAKIVHVAEAYHVVTVGVGAQQLDDVAAVSGVRAVREELTPSVGADGATETAPAATVTNGAIPAPCGSRTSEADTQLRAAEARGAFGFDGTGVTVGVLSDSYDVGSGLATRAADDVLSGDLPGLGNPCGRTEPVEVLQEITSATGAIDEGRAMLQLVHDVAPGARLKFASAFNGIFSFADNIRALRNAGAAVIVDDVTYFASPFYQDGPISVAVNDVTAAGAAYFSSAANNNIIVGGRDVGSYEANALRPATCPKTSLTYLNTRCHDFDPGPGVDTGFGITVAPNGLVRVDLQWAEPWYGVVSDLDLYIVDAASKEVLASSENVSAQNQIPFEFANYTNTTGSSRNVELVINGYVDSGTSAGTPRMKAIFISNRGITAMEQVTSAEVLPDSIFGHNGAEAAGSTAAIRYSSTSTPETFSSRGGPTLVFAPVAGTTAAAALPEPHRLAKPDYTATDGACNTFFLGSRGADGCYRFFGTSAAAPHAAAVAALIRESTPGLSQSAVQRVLRTTATPLSGGSPISTGAGLVDAHAALSSLLDPGVPGAPGGVAGTAGFGSVAVSWTPPADGGSGITAYVVTVTSSADAVSRTVGGDAVGVVLRGLVNGVSYSITVRATNGVGTGSGSAPVSATPTGCVGTRFSDVTPTSQFCPDIAWMATNGISTGTTLADGSIEYRPSLAVARQAMAPFIYRTQGSPNFTAPTDPSFADVPTTHPFYKEIEWMKATGISTGTPQASGKPLYKPTDTVARLAMAAFLYRAAGRPAFTAPVDPSFADVDASSLFYKEIEWMKATGISSGTPQPSGKPLYKPADAVARQAMAAFLHRFATRP
ncbi:MAG: S-layer homology domain-containing protein [Ramlibacter sp.]|nr:S-layer homology domain-containing protein [Cryobacterium sp.]